MDTKLKLIRHKFYSQVVGDILKAIDSRAYGGAYILSFCCIDYFSIPISIKLGKQKTDKTDFMLFLTNYMSVVNSGYSGLENELYAIRCSLVHSYGESDATNRIKLTPHLLYGDILDLHLTYGSDKVLYLYLADFISDLIAAIESFFRDQSMWDYIEEWNSKLYIPQGLNSTYERNMLRMGGEVNYRAMHPTLEILESLQSIENVRFSIKNEIEMVIEAKDVNVKKDH